MKKWKYYSKTDLKKEPCGVIYAEDLYEAYFIGAKIKDLPLNKFEEIFEICEL